MLKTLHSIRRRFSLDAIAVVAVLAVVGALVLVGSASAAQLVPVLSNEPNLVDVAFDSAGDMYVAENNGAVKVLPAASGTIFGQAVTAGQLTTLESLTNVPGLAPDSAGDLFMTDTARGTISVLPAASGTIFGQAVTADQLATLETGLDAPVGLAFDPAGNLYVATQNGVSVLPQSSGTIFGNGVTADTLTQVVSGLSKGAFVAFDPAGNLYVSDFTGGTVSVLAKSSGSVFGTPVTANSVTTLLPGQSDPAGLAFDGAGDLFLNTYGTLSVLPVASGTIAGVPVTANTLTEVANGMLGDLGSTYAGGSVYVADQINESVDRLQAPTATITGVSFGGTVANPVIVVHGTGFETSPPTTAAGCDASGLDYPYGNLFLSDATDGFGAGIPGDCIGLNVAVLSSTEAAYTLGDFYSTYAMQNGDQYTVQVDGASFSGTVAYGTNPSPATITSVAPASGPGGGGTTVRIKGRNLSGVLAVLFGSQPAASFTIANPTSITAVAPPSAAGTVDVALVTTEGVSATSSADRYTFVGPSISSVSPTSGPGSGGTKVTIHGSDLQGATSVTFGSDPAASFTVSANGATITAFTPAESAGTVDVSVTTAGGTAYQPNAFTFLGPTITSVTKASGPAAGGTKVMIKGTGFQGATAVMFGSDAAASYTVNPGGTTITAVTPSEGAGTVDVTVTTPGGSADDPGAFTFLGPAITHLAPGAGPAAGGNTVKITGTDLQGASSVTFGGAGASFTVNDAGTSVTATVPPGSPGMVDVVVTTPGGPSNPLSYTYR